MLEQESVQSDLWFLPKVGSSEMANNYAHWVKRRNKQQAGELWNNMKTATQMRKKMVNDWTSKKAAVK